MSRHFLCWVFCHNYFCHTGTGTQLFFYCFQASAFSASYSDSGLFGCYVVTEAANAPKVQVLFILLFDEEKKYIF